jgi:hypothetical protein
MKGYENMMSQPDTKLIRLLAINALSGVVLACGFVGAMVWFDLHGLRHMIVNDHSPATAILLLLASFIVTFSSVMMGSAIMLIADDHGVSGTPRSGMPKRREHSTTWPAGELELCPVHVPGPATKPRPR